MILSKNIDVNVLSKRKNRKDKNYTSAFSYLFSFFIFLLFTHQKSNISSSKRYAVPTSLIYRHQLGHQHHSTSSIVKMKKN